ncbi:MAG: hypothetical protein FD174_2907 [Geobacteraceae bacterium]|nr:MAG: hypothetical protein FD174_2907 [Geobacteraceae bacterium]
MPKLTINEKICTHCGLCAKGCPYGIISLPDGAVPCYIAGGSDRCILCGHCEALCPTGAIVVNDPRLDPTTYESGLADIEPERLGRYLRMRRSIRRYREESIDKAVVGDLMDIVRFAPTGGNRQPVRWLIIHDTQELRRLTAMVVDWMRSISGSDSPFAARFNLPVMIGGWEEGRDYICWNAPHLVIAYAREDIPVARTDAVIALTHLDIAAPSFGLGTCWGGIFQHAVNSWEPLRGALNLPPEHVSIHCLVLGYPAISYQRPPKRNPASIVWR